MICGYILGTITTHLLKYLLIPTMYQTLWQVTKYSSHHKKNLKHSFTDRQKKDKGDIYTRSSPNRQKKCPLSRRLQDLVREGFLSELGVYQKDKRVGWSFPINEAT